MRNLRAALLVFLVATPAAAINPESIMLSPESAIGSAVLAADDDGGGGWYNPASLGGLTRRSLRLGISAYSLAWVNSEDSLVTVLPWETQGQGTKAFRYSSVPSVLGLTWKLREGLGLSVGLWTPFHDNFAAGFDTSGSGPLPSDPSITTTLTQRYDSGSEADDTWAAASIGWQVLPRLRLGASVQGAYSTTDRSVEFNTLLTTNSTAAGAGGAHLHLRVREKSDVLALRGVLGLQWLPTKNLRFAFLVQTPRMQLFKNVDRVQVVLVGSLLPNFGAQEGGYVDAQPRPEDFAVLEPARLLGGVQVDVRRLSLRLDGDWSPTLDAPGRSLKPSVRVRLGGLYALSRDVTFGLGTSYSTPRTFSTDGALSLSMLTVTGGLTTRSSDVIRALGGGENWDLLSTIAVAGVYGFGTAPGVLVAPLSLGDSVLPVLVGESNRPYLEVPATMFDVSLHFMSSLKF